MSETRRRETREEIVRDMREGAAVFAEKGNRVFADTLAGFAKRVEGMEAAKPATIEEFPRDQCAAAYWRERCRDAEEALQKAGNMAKMRWALLCVKARIGNWFEYDSIENEVETALAAPPRNCDIGTVKEQVERLSKFCLRVPGAGFVCTNCQLKDADICELAWANAPYKPEESANAK